ncbi:YIP1 family protein [Natrarchaeobius sp. A-rgal3]|uniref:YIP1 family protein n=1 Tax=Natrarchaeobius versutus TaxID=1679078 RepID=UPI00350EDB79
MGLAKQWKGVNGYMIKKPSTFFSAYDEDHGIGYPLQFLLVTFAVAISPILLIGVVLNITSPMDAALIGAFVVVLGLMMWIGVVLEAVVAHAVASLFGASGLTRTLEAYAFPSLVRYGLFWFPLVNIMLAFYGLYLQIKALSSFHDISTGKAAVAVLIVPVVVLPIVFVGLILVLPILLAFVMDLGGSAA